MEILNHIKQLDCNRLLECMSHQFGKYTLSDGTIKYDYSDMFFAYSDICNEVVANFKNEKFMLFLKENNMLVSRDGKHAACGGEIVEKLVKYVLKNG